MVSELRRAADEWRATHPSVPTFATRYDLALRDAADSIEDQEKTINAQKDIIKQLRKNRAEYFRDFVALACNSISKHACVESGERRYGMLSAISVLSEMKVNMEDELKEET